MTLPPSLQTIIARRYSRRQILGMGARAGLYASAATLAACTPLPSPHKKATASLFTWSPLGFTEISKNRDITHRIAAGYETHILARWGDALTPELGNFNPATLTAEEQAQRVGYNNDFIALFPLDAAPQKVQAEPDKKTKKNKDCAPPARMLLAVNHEYCNTALMFAGISRDDALNQVNETQGRIEQQAVGCSIIEIEAPASHPLDWQIVTYSHYNRRITATTPMRFSGAAATSERLGLKTAPPAGTFANCAGGVTPWGTFLTAEENINHAFYGKVAEDHPEFRNHQRMGIGEKRYYNWHTFDARFHVQQQPLTANQFGWIVEIDPKNPDSTPIKRTSLGRFKHECATCTTSSDGKLVVYMGDDEAGEFIYRYVSSKRIADALAHNTQETLLDEGTLYVARFNENGTMQWLPLLWGAYPLIPANGFHSQADVMIEARHAATLLGATPMDRPEDITIHPRTGEVYISMTRNPDLQDHEVNVANPRAHNRFGHIIALQPPKDASNQQTAGSNTAPVRHSASLFNWSRFMLAGDPSKPEHAAWYASPPSTDGWLIAPDNLTCDPHGNIWIATDGQPEFLGLNDGLYACETRGIYRGRPKLFFTSPLGAEVTGTTFTPDGSQLFVSIQHPAAELPSSNFTKPATRWPDFTDNMPPRPAIIAIRHMKGQPIGFA